MIKLIYMKEYFRPKHKPGPVTRLTAAAYKYHVYMINCNLNKYSTDSIRSKKELDNALCGILSALGVQRRVRAAWVNVSLINGAAVMATSADEV